jgi:hypothetical protein
MRKRFTLARLRSRFILSRPEEFGIIGMAGPER